MARKRQITTMCPMNCLPTQCGMTVEVEENKLLSLKGDRHNPDSQGFLCIRGRATQEIFENPKRLLHPLRRMGERGEESFEPCSWDEAYAMMVDALQHTARTRRALARAWHRHHGTDRTSAGQSLWPARRFSTVVKRHCLLGDGWLWSRTDRDAQDQHQRGYGGQLAHDCAVGRDAGQPA